MNERIKELAHDAEFINKRHNGDEWRWGYIDPELSTKLEKFAELLIKDICVGLYIEDAVQIYESYGLEYKPEMIKVPNYCDLMPAVEWQQASADHLFIPYDGDGYWATATHESRMSVWRFDKPEWATHVAWYNK